MYSHDVREKRVYGSFVVQLHRGHDDVTFLSSKRIVTYAKIAGITVRIHLISSEDTVV